jgi:hypothetical protein
VVELQVGGEEGGQRGGIVRVEGGEHCAIKRSDGGDEGGVGR